MKDLFVSGILGLENMSTIGSQSDSCHPCLFAFSNQSHINYTTRKYKFEGVEKQKVPETAAILCHIEGSILLRFQPPYALPLSLSLSLNNNTTD